MLAGVFLVSLREVLAGNAGKARLVGMVRRPPHFAGDADAARPERSHVGREQERLAERDDLRLIAHLGALIVETGEVRREQIAGDDLYAGFLEGRHLRREVVAERRELSRIDDGEA